MAKKPIPKEVVDRQMAMVDALAAARKLAEAAATLQILSEDALEKIRALDP